MLWDEFAPNLYALTVSVRGLVPNVRDEQTVRFGLREFKVQGTRFAVNGRPMFLRGTLECAIFPKTGYPPMTGDEWRRIFLVGQGPRPQPHPVPLLVPAGGGVRRRRRGRPLSLRRSARSWAEVGEGKPVDAWLYAESERIIKAYGNHPSFC